MGLEAIATRELPSPYALLIFVSKSVIPSLWNCFILYNSTPFGNHMGVLSKEEVVIVNVR
jgi:hypothetical protein